MKNPIYLLFVLLSCYTLNAQVIITGAVENYDKDFFLLKAETPLKLSSFSDSLFLQKGSFSIKLPAQSPTHTQILTGLTSVFAEPGDSIHLDLTFMNSENGRQKISCRFSGENAAGHQILFDFRVTPEYYYLEDMYGLLENKKDPAVWYEKIRERIEFYVNPLGNAFSSGQIDRPFYQAASELIQVILLQDVFRQLEEDIDSTDPEQLSLSDKRKLAEQLFQEYPPFRKHGYFFDRQHSYANKYFSFLEAGREEEGRLFSYHQPIRQVGSLSCKLPLSYLYFEEKNQTDLAEFFLARNLFTSYQIFSKNPELFEADFECYKALFPGSKYIRTLEAAKIRK